MILLWIKIFHFRQLIMIDDSRVSLDFNSIRLYYIIVFKMLLVLPIHFPYRLCHSLLIPIILARLTRNPELFKPLDQHRLVWFQTSLGCKVRDPQLLYYC